MSGHRGKVAYDAALRDNQVFPGLLWQDRGYELLFRLCEVVENNPELLTEARAAGKAQASSSGEPKVRLTAHVYAELAQKLLDQVPGFDKLFLNYNEAARWTYGARMSSKLAILKKGIFPIPRTPNDSAALLLPKLKNLVSHLFHGQQETQLDDKRGGSETSIVMAHGVSEPMVANLMEHQDDDTKLGSSRANVPANRTPSGITLTHIMGHREETNTLSVPSDFSNDNGIEFEDALQPLDIMDRNGELFPGTPMAIDEDDKAHGIPGVKTPTLGPDSGNVAQNAQMLELTGPAVNRGSSGTQPAQTPMGGDHAVDEDYGDFGAGHHLPHPSTVHMDIKEDDPLRPEDSVSNKGQSAGSPMALDSVSNKGQSAGSPMALDSEVEEDIGDSRVGAKMPQLAVLRQGWLGFNHGSDERSFPASRKRDRGNTEEEEDGDDKEAMKRMKRSTEQTTVTHGDYHHSPSEYQLQNIVSGQSVVSQGVIRQVPSQQDDDIF